MPVSGLVLSLSDEPQPRADTLARIGREARITMGVLQNNRLAIVLDTDSTEEDRQLWDWLGSLAGVSFVEVAFVGFDQAAGVQAGQIPTAKHHSINNGPMPPVPIGETQGERLKKTARDFSNGPNAVVIEDASQDGR